MLADLPPDSLGAYIISMAETASDVLAVVLLQVRQVYDRCTTGREGEGCGAVVVVSAGTRCRCSAWRCSA